MHLALDGAGQQPSYRPVSVLGLSLSRLCAAFPGRFPTEILEEIDRLPAGLLEEILESGAYDRAYATFQHNPAAEGEMVQQVKLITFALVREELDAR